MAGPSKKVKLHTSTPNNDEESQSLLASADQLLLELSSIPFQDDVDLTEGNISIPADESEELFQTPESEDEGSEVGDPNSDGENDDDLIIENEIEDSPAAPSYSPITPPDPTLLSIPTPTPVVDWQWVPDTSLASNEAFQFTDTQKWNGGVYGQHAVLNYFQEFFTPAVIDLIVEQTNNYYASVAASNSSRRIINFKLVTSEDILRLIAVRICMGLVRAPKQTDYFSKNQFYNSSVIPKLMTSDRYKGVLRFLHFADNREQQPGDRLHKIRSVWDMVNSNFQRLYTPGKNVCVDESLVLYKGNLFFKQYIPNKSSKFGVKTYSVADSETGYLLKSIIYQGKGHEFKYPAKEYGFGGGVALELVSPYMNRGRCLYADNYFINTRMAKLLLGQETNVCGTLRRNLKNNPAMKEPMSTGECKTYSSNGILVQRWKDKKEVRMMSTGFLHQMESKRLRSGIDKDKPTTILQYNKNARGIDKCDMVIGMNDLLRKSRKWYMKIFFHLVDVALYNASIIYASHYGKVPFIKFKENIVREILLKFGELNIKKGRQPLRQLTNEKRLTERHFPSYVPSTPKVKFALLECVVCKSKGKRCQQRYQCAECKVGLCADTCFALYHTRANY